MAGDVSRLPVWAQKEIDNLQRRLREANERITVLTEVAGFREGERYGVCVPFGETAFFDGKDADRNRIQVKQHDDGTTLYVNSWHGELSITPRASNSCEIKAVWR